MTIVSSGDNTGITQSRGNPTPARSAGKTGSAARAGQSAPPRADQETRPSNEADIDWKNLGFGYQKTDFNIRYTWREGTWALRWPGRKI